MILPELRDLDKYFCIYSHGCIQIFQLVHYPVTFDTHNQYSSQFALKAIKTFSISKVSNKEGGRYSGIAYTIV